MEVSVSDLLPPLLLLCYEEAFLMLTDDNIGAGWCPARVCTRLYLQMQSLWFLASSKPGLHSQATLPFGASLQM